MLWPFIMLSILWQQSSSPHLLLLWRGISSSWFWTSICLLGLCPNPWYWKSHWRVNSNSSSLACKGPYKHSAWFVSLQVRSPHLFSHSCIPVYLGFWTTLGTLFPSFPALLSAFPNMEPELHLASTVLLTCCCLVVWSVFLSQLFYCFSDLCWTLWWHFQAFLCDNLQIFSLCGNGQLMDQHMYLKLDLYILITALCRYLHWF